MQALAPFGTLDDVVDGLATWERDFRAANDRRCVFATLYGVVSAEVRATVARGGFEDNAWVDRYAVTFANLYRDALVDWEAGRREAVPKAWRLAFETAAAGDALVIQDMLLGVNAHVNRDLPPTLIAVAIEPDRAARYRDHVAVNAVLASVTDRAVARLSALYAPGLEDLDECAGELDELLGMFSLEVARDSAWETAVALTNARSDFERRLVTRMMDARATALARLLRAPSRSRVFMRACRHVEAGPAWLDLAAVIARG